MIEKLDSEWILVDGAALEKAYAKINELIDAVDGLDGAIESILERLII